MMTPMTRYILGTALTPLIAISGFAGVMTGEPLAWGACGLCVWGLFSLRG